MTKTIKKNDGSKLVSCAKTFSRTTWDTIAPTCSVCGRRVFVFLDRAGDLENLRLVNEYRPEYDGYRHLCGACWKRIVYVPCELCGGEFNVLENGIGNLLQNLREHNVTLPEISACRHICEACVNQRMHILCSRCGNPFPAMMESLDLHRSRQELQTWLSPYHPDCGSGWQHLCRACFESSLRSCQIVKERYSKWVRGTKAEYIPGYRIVRTIGHVDYRESDLDEPRKVEKKLRLYSVQLGGNAFIKYFWKQHVEHHSYRSIAGYGPKGNPYYRTRWTTSRWYTGYATAVYVEPIQREARWTSRDVRFRDRN